MGGKREVNVGQAVGDSMEREPFIVVEYRLHSYIELSLKSDCTFDSLCDLTQVIQSFWASVSSSVKWACFSSCFTKLL